MNHCPKCNVDTAEDLCPTCGVDVSDPCPACKQAGYHADGCSESDAPSESV